MSCPPGFEVGLASTCRVTCPPDFKYIQESGTEKCVSTVDNKYYLSLQNIPQGSSSTAYSDEQARFLSTFITLKKKIQTDHEIAVNAKADDVVAHHDQIKSSHGVTDAYSEAIDTLKPFRPPTQPYRDIMNERLSIKEISARDIRILQISLFFVVLCLFEYMLFPSSIVHGVAFFTMCFGLSTAIYLSNR
jgi:hypothetical protein